MINIFEIMIRNYELVTIPKNFGQKFSEFSKDETKEYFVWFLHKKHQRLIQLSEITKEYFIPDYSLNSLKGVYYFFKENINYRIRSAAEVDRLSAEIDMKGVSAPQKDLDDTTISLCFDLGIYFGETLIHNNHGLKWIYCLTPKVNVNYGQPIVKGNNKSEVNPRHLFEVLAYSLIDYKPVNENRVIELYQIWQKSLLT